MWPSDIPYQYISFRRIPVYDIVFFPVFRRAGVTSLEVKYPRFRNGDEGIWQTPLAILATRLLIRTSQVCHRRLAVGRSQQVEEYKHTHTHNISKLTYQGLNDKNWPVYLPVEIVTQERTLHSNNSGSRVDHGEINTFQDQAKNAFNKLPINI